MDRIDTDPKGNQRDRILAILREHTNAKGYVRDVDIEGIARQTGISAHDVAKHMWGMQKQGLVGFSTKHVKGQTVPYRFRLRGSALRNGVSEPTGRPSEATEPVTGISGPPEAETPKEAVLVEATVPFSHVYPEIAEVLLKRDRIALARQAADTLEQAGLDDLAAEALVAISDLTPLESEIIAYVEGHPG